MYSNVKIGDSFLVESRTKKGIYEVSNVTPKRFEVGGFTFNKETGNQVGGDTYSTVSIKSATEEMKKEFKNLLLKNKMARELKNMDFGVLTLEQLYAIKNIIDIK